MADILFHPEAQAEYEAARGGYQARSSQTATRFDAEMSRVLGLMTTHPNMFPQYDDYHRFAVLRRYPFTLVYQIHDDKIYVIAVAHSSRKAGYWRGRS